VALPQEPTWVKERPAIPGWYVGIGSAARTGDVAGDRMAARAQALNDIAAQISVTVAGDLLREVVERNDSLKASVTSLVRASARAELEGVEVAGTYEDGERCWVYLRLDREAHRRRREEKIRTAAELAAGMVVRGRDAESRGDLVTALRSYAQALIPMSGHLDQDVTVEAGGKPLRPVQEAFTSIQRLLDGIELLPPQRSMNVRFGKGGPQPFDVTARRAGGAPVRALPVQFSFLKGSGEIPREVSTDEQGVARCGIRKITSGERIQIIEARIAPGSLLGQDTSSVVRLLLSGLGVPRSRLLLDVTGPLVAVESDESLWDRPLEQKRIDPVLRGRLTEKGFAFVEGRSNASFLVTIKARTRQGSRTMGLCFAFVTVDVSVLDLETGQEIYRRVLTDLKEGSDSFDKAAMKAFGAASSRISDELVPQLVAAVLR
jgi:hypothetical protein